MPTSAPRSNAVPTGVHVLCPHCNQPIDLSSVVSSDAKSNTQSEPKTVSPFVRFGRASGGVLMHYLFPFSDSFDASTPASTAERAMDWPMVLRNHWITFVALVASMVIICLLLMYWGKPTLTGVNDAGLPASIVQPADTTAPVADESIKTAILDTLSQYNQAETEAAALLTMTPLEPLLVADGPLAKRRAIQIAKRQERQAPHRTILLRWAIGDVAVQGTTATVITQETWSNQEVGAVAPEQATVRVTYALWWDETKRGWLIMNSTQTPV